MSAEGWREVRLGDLVTFQRGYDLPKKDMKDGPFPVVASNGIIGYHSEYTTDAPCITIGRSGNVGNPYLTKSKAWAHNTTLYINEYKNTNPIYIYYLLKTLNLGYYSGGSAVPTLNRNHIHPILVMAPKSIEEQRSIAATLSALDDMIELNNQINKILEEMAQAIFKSWFVDFEPFKDGEFEESELGLIPKGWKVVELRDISKDIVCGKTPSTKDKENYGNKMPFITIPDMHGNVFITKTERYLSQKGINTQQNKTLPRLSVCVSCIATPGLVAITSEQSQTNQQINSVICKDNISCFYVYLFMNTIRDTIKTLGSGGSTTLNLNKSQFSKIKIIKCDDRTMEEFHNIVKPLFFNILDNQIENQILSEIRDTLLPKLMSGEIRVPVEEVV